jgi:hypothetical protein
MIDADTGEMPSRPCFDDYPCALRQCAEGTDSAEDCTHLARGGTWESCSSGGEWCPRECMASVEAVR